MNDKKKIKKRIRSDQVRGKTKKMGSKKTFARKEKDINDIHKLDGTGKRFRLEKWFAIATTVMCTTLIQITGQEWLQLVLMGVVKMPPRRIVGAAGMHVEFRQLQPILVEP